MADEGSNAERAALRLNARQEGARLRMEAVQDAVAAKAAALSDAGFTGGEIAAAMMGLAAASLVKSKGAKIAAIDIRAIADACETWEAVEPASSLAQARPAGFA
ncbi:MAG: hypothetical protein AAF192_18955 [Pseudomonadota bacterium]